jgi:glycerophosphoryl diester phosphodiesterase
MSTTTKGALMNTQFRPVSRRWSIIMRIAVASAVAAGLAAMSAPVSQAGPARAGPSTADPRLLGRAVLPYDTFAGGPPAGELVTPNPNNGVTFPLPEQPVEGFSSIVDGRGPGEYLAMEDNGFGGKAVSVDFLIRAYYLRPHFKTALAGTGSVEVGDFISFRDPRHQLPFPIVNENTGRRLLTGGDIDPESLQRGADGDLWVGDEFGPWILHFDPSGRLLDPPYDVPGVHSPNNPLFDPLTATQPNSRGFEGMAISPDGRFLYAALEGATVADTDKTRRNVYEFSVSRHRFTGRVLHYRTEADSFMVADMSAVGRHRVVVIERDAGSGANAVFRRLYLVDLRDTDADGFLAKTQVVDLAAIADPQLVSLPAIHAGDLGLGDPFSVMCESIEAVHQVVGGKVLLGCDNNLPNSGRNPTRPDDSEFVLVDVPALR